MHWVRMISYLTRSNFHNHCLMLVNDNITRVNANGTSPFIIFNVRVSFYPPLSSLIYDCRWYSEFILVNILVFASNSLGNNKPGSFYLLDVGQDDLDDHKNDHCERNGEIRFEF